MRDIFERGYLEITSTTWNKIGKYCHRFPDGGGDFDFYCSLPILRTDADKDIRVLRSGKVVPICL